jgi:hypothetical protein
MIVLVPEPREPVPGGPPSGPSRSLRRTVTRAVTGLGSFTEDALLGLVAAVAGVEYLAVRDLTVPPEIVRRLPGDVIRRHRALRGPPGRR